ncbi:arabinogalactan endo-1,4-beta-galactosidase [Arthrobacter sp. B3I9]|uniref:glycoside hydrolase family 53 protein n=1 Tax=Arthrobacter sp. B3I9 TaxID=3042270 RepID=UPI0027950CFD|nr:glycosyl hydrolase 53 family protein [Arthrobacter sp. B3I9]MDQ0849976.1 arabinogalactan endo-1,4-beta-galactosidase [Arthrobacter sp. B3I9]
MSDQETRSPAVNRLGRKLTARVGRRHVISLIGGGLLAGAAGVIPAPPAGAKATVPTSEAKAATGLRIRGADVSFTLQEEAIGTALRDAGAVFPIEQVLARHGANTVRLRLWVNPIPRTSSLNEVLEMARRAHSVGLKIILDLHYSDTWADGQSQQTPAAWQGLNPDGLGAAVENYTRSVVAALALQGTPAEIVQIGNEISQGMLWPVGRIHQPGGEQWAPFTALLRAGAKGAREGNPARPPLVMLHVETGGDAEASKYFFDNLVARGVPFDLIGLSYYPFWNGPLSKLETCLHELSTRYRKDVIVAETAYPWTLANGDEELNVVGKSADLPEAALYPPTPEGQAKYFERLRDMLAQVPGDRCAGFVVWEPGWLPGVPATPDLGNTHDNLTLFDWAGHGLPALAAFRP